MRIFFEDADQTSDRVTLFLTKTEAGELRDTVDSLLKTGGHEHVANADYSKEVSVCIYEEDGDISALDDRSQRVIMEDK